MYYNGMITGNSHWSPKPNGDLFLLPPSPYISFHLRSSFILAASYATEAPTYGTNEESEVTTEMERRKAQRHLNGYLFTS